MDISNEIKRAVAALTGQPVYTWDQVVQASLPVRGLYSVEAVAAHGEVPRGWYRVGGNTRTTTSTLRQRMAVNLRFIVRDLCPPRMGYTGWSVFPNEGEAETWCRMSLRFRLWGAPQLSPKQLKQIEEDLIQRWFRPWYNVKKNHWHA